MSTFSKKTTFQVIHHFSYIADFLKVPSNEVENQQLIQLTKELKAKIKEGKDPHIKLFLDLVLNNIESYEKNAYPTKPLKAHEMLAFLMEQHHLTQNDLPEIGTQPHVSKILNGKRNLTKSQIETLSKRFNVSPAVFYEHQETRN